MRDYKIIFTNGKAIYLMSKSSSATAKRIAMELFPSLVIDQVIPE